MSRFVSAGTINAETGEVVEAAGEQVDAPEPKKNAEWEAVEKELEAERRRREEARVKALEGGEKSLYDVLQANKAAKQAAFEEQNKIRNQFRALDDDEIDFLDEVRESKRAEEERVRRETEEGLAAFRKAQNQKRPGEEGEGEGEEWTVGPRKKRKAREGRGFGVKREKSEGDEGGKKGEAKKGEVEKNDVNTVEVKKDQETKNAAQGSPPAPAKPKIGLVAYGSDSDDD